MTTIIIILTLIGIAAIIYGVVTDKLPPIGSTSPNQPTSYTNFKPNLYFQISETHYTSKTKRLILYYKQLPGNPHYNEYQHDDAHQWKRLPSMKTVNQSTNDMLNDILTKKHKGRGGSKSFAN
jgi:hypothetical protein